MGLDLILGCYGIPEAFRGLRIESMGRSLQSVGVLRKKGGAGEPGSPLYSRSGRYVEKNEKNRHVFPFGKKKREEPENLEARTDPSP